MRARRQASHVVWAIILAVLGFGICAYKAIVLGLPLQADSYSQVWQIEARVSLEAQGGATKVDLFLPRSTSRLAVLDESYISRGFEPTTQIEEGNRRLRWSIRKAEGVQTFFYHAVIRRAPSKTTLVSNKVPDLEEVVWSEAQSTAAQSLLAGAEQHSADTDTLVRYLLRRFFEVEPGGEVLLLLGGKESQQEKLKCLVSLLAFAKIPARVVHGIELQDRGRKIPFVEWLEVLQDRTWVTYWPRADQGNVPDNLLPWWRGNEPLSVTTGGKNLQVELAIARSDEEATRAVLLSAEDHAPLLLKWSLLTLPVAAQNVYRVLLMVPVGALLVVLLRVFVGFKTFGTFMPVLVALAFRETGLGPGVLLFCVVVTCGLLARSLLERLNLLLVPRLAAVLTIVVFLFMVTSMVVEKLGVAAGASVALFPMVIMTMTIERMSLLWEERGAREAILQALGSLAVAVVATLVMGIKSLEHLLFVFPELLLVLLALMLVIGRYTGYRLSELIRFRALSEEKFQ